MKQQLALLFLLALLNIACSRQQKEAPTTVETDSLTVVLEGDSTIYGLVCDGHTDTILVFLPINNISSNPDTFNILNASRTHRVFGRLKVGDNVAVVRNQQDSTVADFVIDTDDLQNTWCYLVLPTLHRRVYMDGVTEKQMIANLPDSLRELLKVAKEYGMRIKNDHTMFSFGEYRRNNNSDEESIADYPSIKHYARWNLFNGKLLLTVIEPDSLGKLRLGATDTAEFVMMDPDTLVLRFDDGVHSYYRQRNEVSD